MVTRIRAVVVLGVAMLMVAADGQVKFRGAINAVQISGRIVDPTGSPVPDQTVTFRNRNENGGLSDSDLETDKKGRFAFAAKSGVVYQARLTVAKNPPTFRGIGTLEVVYGRDVAMGDIVLQFSPEHEPIVHLAGPIRITQPMPGPYSVASSVRTGNGSTIAALYIACAGVRNQFCEFSTMHVINGDLQEVQPPADKEQVGTSSPLISEDKRAGGWLVDYSNCCTSYPLSRKLMVYRPGKPLRVFNGDGRALFAWRFVAGGRQVAFYQDFPHFISAQHYELRDVETGRLMDKWDGELTSKSPPWVRTLEGKPGF